MAHHGWSPSRSMPGPRADDDQLEAELAAAQRQLDQLVPNEPGHAGARSRVNYLSARIRQRDAGRAREEELSQITDPGELADLVEKRTR